MPVLGQTALWRFAFRYADRQSPGPWAQDPPRRQRKLWSPPVSQAESSVGTPS